MGNYWLDKTEEKTGPTFEDVQALFEKEENNVSEEVQVANTVVNTWNRNTEYKVSVVGDHNVLTFRMDHGGYCLVREICIDCYPDAKEMLDRVEDLLAEMAVHIKEQPVAWSQPVSYKLNFDYDPDDILRKMLIEMTQKEMAKVMCFQGPYAV